MPQIVECVPNFSEGRDRGRIDQIVAAIRGVSGVEVKDVDPGADTNRTVVTFVGTPEAVLAAAFAGISTARDLIDMSVHRGAHPRLGATDVCPFVPVSDVTMEECVALAERLAKRVGSELEIPVYLYEAAARRPERRSLAEIRRGEYEGLAEKLLDPEWAPDFGPAVFHPRAGATVIGAREFLIAFNINLNSRAKEHATDIAFELREKGRAARRPNKSPFYGRGELVRHEPGRFYCGTCLEALESPDLLFLHSTNAHAIDYRALMRLHDQDPAQDLVGLSALRPGRFRHCRAIGWEVASYDRAQISINLTDWRVTPPHVVLEAARDLARERGLVVTGSEIVGLVPLPAMTAAGRDYLERQGRSAGVPLVDLIHTAVQSMGLSDVAPFRVEEKVLGYPADEPTALVRRSVRDFTDEVSRDSPAPGGGSVAALMGALGCGLGAMVTSLSVGKMGRNGGSGSVDLSLLGERVQHFKSQLLHGVDLDSRAFEKFLVASRLPKATPEERLVRDEAMEAGLRAAIDVPMESAKVSLAALDVLRCAAEESPPASVSDAGVGALALHAALLGALLNVRINLRGLRDRIYATELERSCSALEAEATQLLTRTLEVVRARF